MDINWNLKIYQLNINIKINSINSTQPIQKSMTQDDFNNSFNNYWKVDHPTDCQQIQNIASGMGVSITLQQAEIIWGRWSDSVSAGWLAMGSDSDIQNAINLFVNTHS